MTDRNFAVCGDCRGSALCSYRSLIIPDITKTESNNCFIIHCFEENNDKRILTSLSVHLTLLSEIMHCARNLQITR